MEVLGKLIVIDILSNFGVSNGQALVQFSSESLAVIEDNNRPNW